jgi:hypothetical protein
MDMIVLKVFIDQVLSLENLLMLICYLKQQRFKEKRLENAERVQEEEESGQFLKDDRSQALKIFYAF